MKQIGLTADAVIIRDGRVLLVKRRFDPFKGMWALPGGFVEHGEATEGAVRREVLEETCLEVKSVKLLGVYSDPKRDPRGRTVTIAYVCEAVGEPNAGDDAAETRWWPLNGLPETAFDHGRIIGDFKKAIRQANRANAR